MMFGDNAHSHIRTYQLPISVHDVDNGNEAAGNSLNQLTFSNNVIMKYLRKNLKPLISINDFYRNVLVNTFMRRKLLSSVKYSIISNNDKHI